MPAHCQEQSWKMMVTSCKGLISFTSAVVSGWVGNGSPSSPACCAELPVMLSPCQTSASFRLSPGGAKSPPRDIHMSLLEMCVDSQAKRNVGCSKPHPASTVYHHERPHGAYPNFWLTEVISQVWSGGRTEAAAALFHLPGWESVTCCIPKAALVLSRTEGLCSSPGQGPKARSPHKLRTQQPLPRHMSLHFQLSVLENSGKPDHFGPPKGAGKSRAQCGG